MIQALKKIISTYGVNILKSTNKEKFEAGLLDLLPGFNYEEERKALSVFVKIGAADKMLSSLNEPVSEQAKAIIGINQMLYKYLEEPIVGSVMEAYAHALNLNAGFVNNVITNAPKNNANVSISNNQTATKNYQLVKTQVDVGKIEHKYKVAKIISWVAIVLGFLMVGDCDSRFFGLYIIRTAICMLLTCKYAIRLEQFSNLELPIKQSKISTSVYIKFFFLSLGLAIVGAIGILLIVACLFGTVASIGLLLEGGSSDKICGALLMLVVCLPLGIYLLSIVRRKILKCRLIIVNDRIKYVDGNVNMGCECLKLGNYSRAYTLFSQPAKDGDTISQLCCGFLCNDDNESFSWYLKSASASNCDISEVANAKFNLGVCYYKGKGTQKDIKQAIDLFTQSAKGNFIDAQKCLGFLAYERNDLSEAMKWYRLAADSEDSVAQYNLGLMLINKSGKEKLTGIEYLRKAAIQGGNSNAQLALADCYHTIGEVQNDKEALKWYKTSQEHGNFLAEYELGKFYITHVPKDLEQALYWYRQAAEHGIVEAEDAATKLSDVINALKIGVSLSVSFQDVAVKVDAGNVSYTSVRHSFNPVPEDIDIKEVIYF